MKNLAQELRELSNTYVKSEIKEYIFEQLILPKLKRAAESGETSITINNFDSDSYTWKKDLERLNLRDKIDEYSLAYYCKYQLKPLLKSKGFDYSEASPFYHFTIKF